MDEISDNDFREFVKTVQDMALRAYPNPGRVDCPGSQVIHEVAGQSQPSAHPIFQSHIVHCSPCIRDVLAERTRIQSQQKTRRWLVLAAVAACVCLIVVVSFLLLRSRASRPGAGELAQGGSLPEIPIDLRPLSPTRSETAQKNKPPLTVPNARVKLKIYLALGSPEGPYEVGVLTNQLKTITKQEATTSTSDGTTYIPIAIDLGGLPAGAYLLAVRPMRDGEEWQTYKLLVQRAR